MIRSIERHLLAWLLGALCTGAALLMLASYLVTLDEMDELFDENMKQVALAVASQARFDGDDAARPRDALPALPRLIDQHGNFDFVVLTWSPQGRLLHVSDKTTTLPFTTANGLSELTVDQRRWHIYTIAHDAGVIQIAQRASSRRALAAETASKLLLPLIALIGLIGALLVGALRRGLRPLDQAAAGVAARSAATLDPIDASSLPREIHPLIASINGLMVRLAEAFDTQRRFTADAAHELRSPITVLRMQMQLVDQAHDEGARRRALADLRAGIERVQRLVEQLLSLSRVGPDAPRRPPARIDLGAAVRDCVAQLSLDAQRAGIDLGAQADERVDVVADRHEIDVLLANLVGNAIRYTQAGGTVDVRATHVDGRPALQVVDNGPGVGDAERERVFDRFYRGADAADVGRGEGSGLGLSIVRAIADRQSASVSLLTPPGGRGLEARVVFARSPDKG